MSPLACFLRCLRFGALLRDSSEITHNDVNAGRRSRVLVVDPHADIAEVLRRALEVADRQVESASSMASAITQMERHQFAVALVNLTLPDGDGLSLLRLLKSRDPSLEVILMTGSCPANSTVKDATEQGAFHCLFKPFDLDEMLTVVANAELRRKLADSDDAASLA